MEQYVPLLLVIVVIIVGTKIIKSVNNKPEINSMKKTDIEVEELNKNNNIEKEIEYPYLLTNSVFSPKEEKFYQCLKPITEKLELTTLVKMRLADIVYIPKNTPNYTKWFNYIKAKHIDFIICNKFNEVVLLIELDDSSHSRADRIERDNFVDSIFKKLNVPILHIKTWTNDSLDFNIRNILNLHDATSQFNRNKDIFENSYD